MRCRAQNRNAVTVTCERITGSRASPDPGRPRAEHAGLGRVRAACAELDHVATTRRMRDTRRLGRNERFERDAGKQIRLRYLALDQRRSNVQNGLTFVKDGALRNGENIAGEPETRKVIPEL